MANNKKQVRGMADPIGLDAATAGIIRELQDNIVSLSELCDDLQSQINSIELAKSQSASKPVVFRAGLNTQVDQSGGRIMISATDTKPEYLQFEVVEIKDDYLNCYIVRSIDSSGHSVCDSSPQLVPVAKPWLLRKTPFDGKTRDEISYEHDETDPCKRTATKDGEEEVQSVTPSYSARDDEGGVSGEIITAVEVLGTLKTEDNKPIVFLDINLGGRCWAVDDSE